METFQLIFSGKRCGDYSKLPIEEHLILLKLPQSTRNKISSANSIALKSNLSYANAIKQQQKLVDLGFETTLKLELTERLFRLGFKKDKNLENSKPLIPANKDNLDSQQTKTTEPSQTEEFDESRINIVEKGLTDPILFSRPGSYQIRDLHQHKIIQLNSLSYSFRGLFLTAISVFVAFNLQSYFILFFLNLGLPNTLASIFGIVFLFTVILGLPKIIQPLQYFEFTKEQDSIHLIEKPKLMFGSHTVIWANQIANSNGEFSFSANSALAKINNETYYWNAKLQINSTGQQSIEDIQDAILDGTAVETIISIFNYFKKVFDMLSPHPEQFDWREQTSSVITDSNNKVVALIYLKPKKAYYIIENDLSDNLILHAFCAYILRDRLV